jgi:hypothetical protein
MPVYWDNNKCGNCGYTSPDLPVEKITCEGEQAGLETCRACAIGPEAPSKVRRTREFILSKVHSMIAG